jgi:hypothetical protein
VISKRKKSWSLKMMLPFLVLEMSLLWLFILFQWMLIRFQASFTSIIDIPSKKFNCFDQ